MNENVVLSNASLRLTSNDNTTVEGTIVLDTDSGNVYLNSTDGEKILLASAIQYLDDDAARADVLVPEMEVLYVVRSTSLVWIWYNSSWVNLNPPIETYFDIDNVEIPIGTTGVAFNDDRITVDCVAVFVPIEALYDLATAEGVTITCTCNNGSVTAISTCQYPLIGKIKIIK